MHPRHFILGFGLVYAALLAQGLRVERPEFRPWELLALEDGRGFQPSQRVEMTEIGDLGFVTWVPALQVPRDTVFTTDRWGHRNPEERAAWPVVMIGDSFTVGSGVSDDQTLPAQLAARVGAPVYNYGIPSATGPVLFYADPRFTAAPPRVVVLAPNQRQIKVGAFAAPRGPRPRPADDEGVGAQLRAAIAALERDNGLTQLARRAVQTARYRALGTVPGHTVVTVDGAPAILLSAALQRLSETPEARGVPEYLASLGRFRAALEARGTRLVFAPLPDQGLLYPELYAAEERATFAEPSVYAAVIAGARAAGIDTVDVAEALRDQRTPYLYLRDDSHLTPDALGRVATVLAPAVRAALGAPSAAEGAR